MGGNYGVNGALAEQLKPAPRMRLVERQPDISEREQPNLSQAIQGTLFQASNVISMPPRLEPKTRAYYNEFSICTACDQIYWKGSHYERIRQFIDNVIG